MTQYVYLSHTREFFNAKQPIYKIGKTTKQNFTRFSEYARGSVMLFQSSCSNCHELERKIITLFTSKYELKRSIGTEYFEGDYRKMIRDMCDIVSSEEIVDEAVKSVIKNVIVEDYEKIIHDTVVDEVIKNVIGDSEEIIDDTVVDKDMNANSDEITNDVVVNDSSQIRNDDINVVKDQFCCMTCKYFTNVKSNLQKHFHTKKHISLVTPEAVDTTTASKWQCNVCDKYYKSQSGLWKHSQVCKEVVPIPEVMSQDLHTKIDNLENIIVEMAKSNNRQQ
jgi:uncharacterized membrane-anchored protein YjiN (DUF445 family)